MQYARRNTCPGVRPRLIFQVHYFVFQGHYFIIPELWVSWFNLEYRMAFKNLSSVVSSCLFLLLFLLKSFAWQEGNQITEAGLQTVLEIRCF